MPVSSDHSVARPMSGTDVHHSDRDFDSLERVPALIVEPSPSDAASMVETLSEKYFHVTVAPSFERAKARLAAHVPRVLITEVRLGEYNGLQLVLYGKALHREMAALVLSDEPDPVLERDAEAMGATFVHGPLTPAELTAAVFRTIFRELTSREAVGPIRPPFERRTGPTRVVQQPVAHDRRRRERRRDLPSLLRVITGELPPEDTP